MFEFLSYFLMALILDISCADKSSGRTELPLVAVLLLLLVIFVHSPDIDANGSIGAGCFCSHD